MRFFSKIVFIFNLCYVVRFALGYVELQRRAQGNNDAAIPLPFIEGSITILALVSVFTNLLFAGLAIVWIAKGRSATIPRWVMVFNLLILPAQLYLTFFYNYKTP